MVGVSKIQRANANYWIEAVAEGGEDYYTKPGESPGRWLGSAAAELGLEGEIDRATYAAALAGRDPSTGQELVHRPAARTFTDAAGRERRLEPVLGFDVRFAAPKSVSLLYALGSPEVRAAALCAHDDAVAEAVGYLEQSACFVSRGRGGKRFEPGTGFLAMAFRHRSSRAGDPALHTHVLVSNLTRARSDGRWLSLASPRRRSPLFHQAKAAGYVYQAVLRAAITRELGLEFGPIRNGYADLELIGRPAIEHFSQRRVEIEQAMAERGASSARAAEVAAYCTRAAKDYGVDADGQRADWLARAAEFDLRPAAIEAALAVAPAREPRPISTEDIDAALASLERDRSHFGRRDLLCALAGRLVDGASAAAIEQAVDSVIHSGELIEVHTAGGPLDPTLFTTPRLWALEQRVIAIARDGLDAGVGTVTAEALAAVLERHRYLGAEQAAMVTRLVSGGERVLAVAARPGAGKTTALAAARQAWEEAGYPVIGVASARSASGELSDAGVPATSIAALLIRVAEWEARGVAPLAAGTVIVLDEASTVSTSDAAALAELTAGCGGKLVAIGDPRQISSIGAGGVYEHLTKTLEPIELSEIRRQRDPADRRVVELAHAGRGSDAIDLLRSRERLIVTDTLPDALDAIVLDWAESFNAGEDAVMVARRSRDVAELNAKARQLLAAKRDQAGPSLRVGGEDFRAGEQLITRINSSQVSNRERWRVEAVDPDKGAIELSRVGGEARRVRLERGELSRLTPRGEPAIQHAYALTAYATESKTFDSVFVLVDPGASREEFLVGISRSRGATHVYGVASLELTDPELGPATRELEDSAHEIRAAAERPGAEPAAAEVATRERLATLPVAELAQRRRRLREQERRGGGRSATDRRLEALERRITFAGSQLEDFEQLRSALRGHRRPDPGQLARVESQIVLGTKQLSRLTDERQSLAVEAAIEQGLGGAERLELALAEERIAQLARREVAAERLQPSALVLAALGERPSHPGAAALWNEGVHAIHAYRSAHAITTTALALGPRPRGSDELSEWRAANRTLSRVRAGLDLDFTPPTERAASIEV